jgi:hypothetical protein
VLTNNISCWLGARTPKPDKDRHKEDRDAGDAQLGFWCYSNRESENKERKKEEFCWESDTSHFLFSVFIRVFTKLQIRPYKLQLLQITKKQI